MHIENTLRVHGHRGCRGLFPENTIPAFVHAVNLGVDVLEMDVVLSADGNVVVSHEPFISAEIFTHPDGKEIGSDEQFDLNIFRMSTTQITSFLCGAKTHPLFPEQKKLICHKPLLSEVVGAVRNQCSTNGKNIPLFNIEIKSREEWDGIYHPDPITYAEKIFLQSRKLAITDTCYFQSFDSRILNALFELSADLHLILLAEKSRPLQEYLDALCFVPFGFSPLYSMITDSMVQQCNESDLELIAWTVNKMEDAEILVRQGVKHIITDYPNLLLELRNKFSTPELR